jgi:radical SAM superfamily enzyme YgiQ (UPF0313 family)
MTIGNQASGGTATPGVPSQKILLVKPYPRLATILGLQRFMLLEPLEFGYLAAAAPSHEYRVLDLRLHRSPLKAFQKTLRSFRPDIVGFTGYSHESSVVKLLAQIVREKLPRARVIAGGHHATSAPHDFNLPQIDAIVRGEGCASFRQLVEAIALGMEGKDLTGVPNVLVPGASYDAEAAMGWPLATDPAEMPRPRRDLWDTRSYYTIWAAEKLPRFASVFPTVAMVRTSWGCHMKCSFCVVPHLSQQTHRPRPVDSVADELESLDTDYVYFSDDENFINKEFSWELAEEIERRGIQKRYFAWTRSTTINRSPDLLQKWAGIGLDSTFIGFEFIDDAELKAASKASTVSANEKALDTMRSMDVVVHAAFILRGEYDVDDFEKLRAYVRAMPPSQCSFTCFTPIPGTAEYGDYEKKFWVPKDRAYDLHDCMHPLMKTTLPLREFSARFATQVIDGIRKTPLRSNHHLAPPLDMLRVWQADRGYHHGFHNLYRDYPEELWD